MLGVSEQNIIELISVIKKSINSDIAFTLLVDGHVAHINQAEGFTINAKVGDKMPINDPAHEVFKSGIIKDYSIPKDLFGVPLYGRLVPITDKKTGSVSAVIASAFSVERQRNIENASTNLSKSLEQTELTVEEFAKDIQKFAGLLSEIQNICNVVEEKIVDVSSLIKSIQSSASTSNILALNASIEAARAGEAGKGFTVVANEMGKLAQKNADMASKINNDLTNMFKHLSDITKSVQNSNEVATNQAATIEEITATLQNIYAESELLAIMAKE